jgi:hypothetical protein
MSEANKKQLSAAAQELVSSLMQATPDMLEALAEYAQLPQGVWLCTLKTSTEAVILKDPDVPYMRIEATIDDILGIADDVDELDIPKLGSICSELFNLAEPIGQGMLRRRLENLKAIMERPEGTSNADILNDANGLQIKIITGPFRKADNGNNYTNIKGYAPAD